MPLGARLLTTPSVACLRPRALFDRCWTEFGPFRATVERDRPTRMFGGVTFTRNRPDLTASGMFCPTGRLRPNSAKSTPEPAKFEPISGEVGPNSDKFWSGPPLGSPELRVGSPRAALGVAGAARWVAGGVAGAVGRGHGRSMGSEPSTGSAKLPMGAAPAVARAARSAEPHMGLG